MDHLRHSLFACVCVGLLGLIAGQLTSVSILIAANIGAIYALIWLAIPVSFSQTPREKQDLYRTLALSTRGFDFGVTVALLLIPAFFLGRYLFCLSDDLSTMIVPGFCARSISMPFESWWEGFEIVLVQIFIVALPEEFFFRGFLLSRLEKQWPPRFRFLKGGIGIALVISSALFAVAHFGSGNFGRLATFFPGLLLGWLRSATGTIVASIIVHVVSNILIRMV